MTNQNKIDATDNQTVENKTIFDESPDTISMKSAISSVSQTQNFGRRQVSQNIFFNTCFDKNHLKTLIAWFLAQYGEKITVDLVETLKQVGFHQATSAGVSLGIDDLKIPPQKDPLLSQAAFKLNQVKNAIRSGNLTNVEKSQRLIETWNQTSETLRQTAVQNFRTTNPVNPVYMMAFSGARGNISQVRQLVAMRGLMADPQGAILEFPIQSNFREGLTVTEYLISCYGARKGLVDTALRTATSGYLTRRLVDAVQHVVIHVTDCQSKKGIVIKGKNFEQRLIGRVLFDDIFLKDTTLLKKNTLISPDLAKQIAFHYKEIVVRSPLTCQTEKSVCQLCYGLDLSQGKLVSIGEAVGIIAAQSIGEPGTQLTMRTFHTGGVGVFSGQAMKAFTAPFEGKIEFLEPLSGLFVRTPDGNIVYLLKHKSVEKNKPILKLTSETKFESRQKQKPNIYQILQSDVPPGSLLWVKQGEYVKSGQLLLQASRLQTVTQEMPESSHPVRAPIAGEVFFDSMAVRIVEEEKRLISKKKKQQVVSQFEQKEISPKFPTLINLGNFWIFSTFVQKETSFCNSFFFNGDLFSSQTPIQQHNLHIFYTGQLKKRNSSVVFGQNYLKFLFSNINYSGLFYFIQKRHQKNKNTLLTYTHNTKTTLLSWYPCFSNDLELSGYFSPVGLNYDFIETRKFDINENSKAAIIEKFEGTKYPNLSYLWSPHQVLKLNKNQIKLISKNHYLAQKKLSRSGCFIISQTFKSFSKTGIFQVEADNNIIWNFKSRFETHFVKNLHQNSNKKDVKQTSNIQPKVSHNLVNSKNQVISKLLNVQKETGLNQSQNYSKFLKINLTPFQKQLFHNSYNKFIEKKQIWAYIPKTLLPEKVSSQLSGIFLQPGKKFENIRFLTSPVAINIIHSKNILFLKSKFNNSTFSYSLLEILNSQKQFQTDFGKIQITNQLTGFQKNTFNRQFHKIFCFYKQHDVVQIYTKKLVFNLKTKKFLSHVLFFQKNSYQIFSTIQFLKQHCLFEKIVPSVISLKSPLFTKQFKTSFKSKPYLKQRFKVFTPSKCGWFLLSSFIRIELQINVLKSFNKTEHLKQNLFIENNLTSKNEFNKFQNLPHFKKQVTIFNKKDLFTKNDEFKSNSNKKNVQTVFKTNQSLIVPGFSIFFYQPVKLQNSNEFKFFTFQNGMILPEWKISEAFFMSKKLGEFRGVLEKQQQSFFSILQIKDRTILKIPQEPFLNQLISTPSRKPKFRDEITKTQFLQPNILNLEKQVGVPVRWGQQLSQGFAVPISGQIIKTTLNTFTLRKGVPLVASIRGLVHTAHKDLVEKNELLITLRSRRLQTEDIVQGIPKIEQLFEARETQGGELIQNNMHTLLNNFFIRARQVKPFDEAVELSLIYIQKFLVENILEAYSNQGVTIAEKHVEVVVRQMTARVRITYGGDTGFLPGEIVQLRWIEKINMTISQLGRRQAEYEPLILGITKSVLQSESFLVAASFQQVSKVLVRSALAKKTDFLRGLHENILVGQPIPAGTGTIELSNLVETTQEFFYTLQSDLNE